MDEWLTQGPRPCYWISCYFFPQGFMTSVKQTFSRDNAIAIDTLVIGCGWTRLTPETLRAPDVPKAGVLVYGPYMEGARFNARELRIDESKPGTLFEPVPLMHVNAVLVDEFEIKGFECPLYKTSIRAGTLSTTGHSTNFCCTFDMPVGNTDANHWVRRGAAMLCMLDT